MNNHLIKKTAIFLLIIGSIVSLKGYSQQNSKADYAFNRMPLLQGANAELPLGSIKARGWLLKQLELQRDGATGHAEELYPEDGNLGKNSDWLGGKGEGWERVPYYVKGLIVLAYTLDDDVLKAKAAKWINWTLDNQQSDGLFGPAKMDDWWPRMPMMYAIRSYYEATGDNRVISFLTKYFKYQHQNIAGRPLKEWSKSRTGDNIELVLWLYNKTGEKFLLSLAETLKKQAYPWRDIFSQNGFYTFGDDFHTKHAVSVGQALKFPAIYYQKSKDAKDKDAFYKGVDHLTRDHGQSSGMVSGTEFLAGKSSVQGTETCTVVEWMQSLETSARIFQDAAIGDRLEKIAFNALPAQYSRNIKEHLYYAQPNQVFCKHGNVGFDEDYVGGILLSPYSGMGCCRYNMHMGWPYFVKNSWVATPDKGLAVIAYGPMEVNAVVAGNAQIRLVEDTNYPFEEQIRIGISLDKTAKFPLKLRIPAWCSNPGVSLNGRKLQGLKAGQIFVIDRRWSNNDKLVLDFPMNVVLAPQVNNSTSVERGPIVYALQMKADYFSKMEHPVKGFHDYEVSPSSPWNYGLIINKNDPDQSIQVEKGSLTGNPFVQKETPVKLTVKARRIPGWTISYNGMYASEVPYGPVASSEPVEEITLVPYGSENIRISCFPEIGTPTALPGSFASDFDDNTMRGWVYYGGGWFAENGALKAASNAGSWGSGIHGTKAIAASAKFANFAYEADITLSEKGNAGLIFRVSNPAIGAEFYEGYYVGMDVGSGRIEIGKASHQRWLSLTSSGRKLISGQKYRIRIEAQGPDLSVFFDNEKEPVLTTRDSEFKFGSIGVRSYDSLAAFDNIKVVSY